MDFSVVLNELMRVTQQIVSIIPDLVNGIILLIVGYLVAWVARWIVRLVLKLTGFDALMERTGLVDGLRSVGIATSLSRLLSQVVFLFILLSFGQTAMQIIGLLAIATLFGQVLIYLPNVIGALVVFLLGNMAVTYVGKLFVRSGQERGLQYASSLGRVVQTIGLLVVLVLALSTLNIDTSILVTIVTIGVAAFAVAFSLSLGLGARHLIQEILSSYYVRDYFPEGQTVRFGDVDGTVSRIGTVNTVITTSEETVTVANTTLLHTTVRGPRDQAPPAASDEAPQPPTAD